MIYTPKLLFTGLDAFIWGMYDPCVPVTQYLIWGNDLIGLCNSVSLNNLVKNFNTILNYKIKNFNIYFYFHSVSLALLV